MEEEIFENSQYVVAAISYNDDRDLQIAIVNDPPYPFYTETIAYLANVIKSKTVLACDNDKLLETCLEKAKQRCHEMIEYGFEEMGVKLFKNIKNKDNEE